MFDSIFGLVLVLECSRMCSPTIHLPSTHKHTHRHRHRHTHTHLSLLSFAPPSHRLPTSSPPPVASSIHLRTLLIVLAYTHTPSPAAVVGWCLSHHPAASSFGATAWVCVFVFVCLCVRARVCACVWAWVLTRARVWLLAYCLPSHVTRMYVSVCARVCARVCVCVRVRVHV